jgi:hypothetical protein
MSNSSADRRNINFIKNFIMSSHIEGKEKTCACQKWFSGGDLVS